MARVFTTSQNLSVADAAAIQNLPSGGTFWIQALVYRTGTGLQMIAHKGTFLSGGWWFGVDMGLSAVEGCPRLWVSHGSLVATRADAVASGAGNAATANTLVYLCGQFDAANAQDIRLYRGLASGTIAETAYDAATIVNKVGSYWVDTGAALCIGSDHANAQNMKGRIERIAFGTGVLTVADMTAWRDSIIKSTGTAHYARLSPTGASVSPELDESGNGLNLTVNSATVVASIDQPARIAIGDFHDTRAPADATTHIRASQFARVQLTTTADTLDLTQFSTLDSTYLDNANCVIRKDGAFLARSDMGAGSPPTPYDSYKRNSIALGSAGVSKVIEIVAGVGSRSSLVASPVFPEVTMPVTIRLTESGGAAPVTLTAPSTPSRRLYLLADSLAGFLANAATSANNNTGSGAQYSWPILYRAATGRPVIADTWGGNALQRQVCVNTSTFVHDATTVNATAARIAATSPSVVMIALGANDRNFFGTYPSWTTTAFQNGYIALLQAIQSALPGARIYAMSPWNSVGLTNLAVWRTAVQNAAAAVSGVVFVDGTTVLPLSAFTAGGGPGIDASDGVHVGATNYAIASAFFVALNLFPPTGDARRRRRLIAAIDQHRGAS